MKVLNEKLKNLLFLELKKEKASEIFNLPELKDIKEDIYLPINTDFLVKNINDEVQVKNIPVEEFIVGIAYSIGADNEFRYKEIYTKIFKAFKDSSIIVKKKSSQLFKNKKLLDSFILLNGLNEIERNVEVENTLLNLIEELSIKDYEYIDNGFIIADRAIANNNINGYLIRASLNRMKKDDEKELLDLREYLRLGGTESSEITDELKLLERNTQISEAYQNVIDKPLDALEVLLTYYNEEKNNPKLLLNIAVCYRLLNNNAKAIIYLEEAMALDNEYLDVVNELGLNYAMLNDFKTASTYFEPVFKATGEMAPLTNLMICYFNLDEKEKAMDLFEKAKHIDPDDEILQIIEKTYLQKND